MEQAANLLWDAFLLSVHPVSIIISVLIVFIFAYRLNKNLFRSALIAISFPGFISFVVIILALNLNNATVIGFNYKFIPVSIIMTLGFPSLFFGFPLFIKSITDEVRKEPDYRFTIIYGCVVLFQIAFSIATVMMRDYPNNDL